MATIIPKVDKTRANQLWFMWQIYTGPNGTGAYVPNVDDAILDWSTGMWRVIAVDYTTNLSSLSHVNPFTFGGGVTDEDYAIVTSPGSNHYNFRVYVNTKVVPHTMFVDTRTWWNGEENALIKIFKGTDISTDTGVVISAMIDQNGTVLSENIPLENVIIPNGTNISRKTPQGAYCTYTPTNGDKCTIVTYTADGAITSVDTFVIAVTDAMRTIDQSREYVTNIELLSPFMSATDNRLIECPINMVTQSLMMTGRVTYSDGNSIEYPIDGTHFELSGSKFLTATQVNQTVPLILIYKLAANELTYDATAALLDRTMREKYNVKITELDTFYAVKIFAAPYWSGNQYYMNYYMYNLERDIVEDVTAYVTYSPGTPVFNGTNYTGTQTLTLALNLAAIGPSYANFNYVQTIAVTLLNPANSSGKASYFTVGYTSDAVYGNGIRAKYAPDDQNVGAQMLDLSCGLTSYLQWLSTIYNNLDPLYYSGTETSVPIPSHVVLKIGSIFTREIAISDILTTVRNIAGVTIVQGSTIRLDFIKRETSGDKQLATLSMVASAS